MSGIPTGSRQTMRQSSRYPAVALPANEWQAPLWMALILATGIGMSTFFACATPFAALGTIAALKLEWRPGLGAVALVWLANQTIGFGMLGYPWTWDCAAWGVAIGVSTGLAMLAASGLSPTRPASFVTSLPFVAAFTTFELALYIAGLVLPGSDGAFSIAIVGHVFLLNALTLCVLIAAFHLIMLTRRLLQVAEVAPVPTGVTSLR